MSKWDRDVAAALAEAATIEPPSECEDCRAPLEEHWRRWNAGGYQAKLSCTSCPVRVTFWSSKIAWLLDLD